MKAWIAEHTNWGVPYLAQIEIARETKKTWFMNVDVEPIKVGDFPIPYYSDSGRLAKDKYHVFSSLDEALGFLLDSARKQVEKHRRDWVQAEAHYEALCDQVKSLEETLC